MAKKNYVPRRRQPFRAWHANFKTKAHTLATKYGVTTGQLAEVDQNDGDVIADFDDADQKDLTSRAANSKGHATQLRAEKAARKIAQQIKKNPAYTDEDGALFDIIGPEDSTDPNTAKPVLRLRIIEQGKVEVDFVKQIFTGVKIFSRRGNETAFTFLGTDTQPPYDDTRSNIAAGAETRQYQAIFLDGDDEVGLMSDTVSIAVTGTPGGGGGA